VGGNGERLIKPKDKQRIIQQCLSILVGVEGERYAKRAGTLYYLHVEFNP
jgi:hypothetical protein